MGLWPRFRTFPQGLKSTCHPQGFWQTICIVKAPSKEVDWFGSSKAELLKLPKAVVREVGRALNVAQHGGLAAYAKPLRGFKGAAVIEIVVRFQGQAFRTIYTTVLRDRIWVLYSFQKKSTHGISTPKPDLEIIRSRLQALLERHGS